MATAIASEIVIRPNIEFLVAQLRLPVESTRSISLEHDASDGVMIGVTQRDQRRCHAPFRC